jgi:hypothetical protein
LCVWQDRAQRADSSGENQIIAKIAGAEITVEQHAAPWLRYHLLWLLLVAQDHFGSRTVAIVFVNNDVTTRYRNQRSQYRQNIKNPPGTNIVGALA